MSNGKRKEDSKDDSNDEERPYRVEEVQEEEEEEEKEEEEAKTLRNKKKPKHDSSPDTKMKHIVLGDYDIAIPDDKFALFGVIVSAIIFYVAVVLEKVNDRAKGYTTFATVFAFSCLIIAFISLVLPNKNSIIMIMNYFLFLWSFVGACIMTSEGAPFNHTGNGFFASWSCFFFSAAASNRSVTERVNTLFDFGAASTVVLIALSFAFHNGIEDSKEEAIYAIVLCCITLSMLIPIILVKVCKNGSRFHGETVVLAILAMNWIIASCLITFRGPFTVAGNGYFASWAAAILSVKAVDYSWHHQSEEENIVLGRPTCPTCIRCWRRGNSTGRGS